MFAAFEKLLEKASKEKWITYVINTPGPTYGEHKISIEKHSELKACLNYVEKSPGYVYDNRKVLTEQETTKLDVCQYDNYKIPLHNVPVYKITHDTNGKFWYYSTFMEEFAKTFDLVLISERSYEVLAITKDNYDAMPDAKEYLQKAHPKKYQNYLKRTKTQQVVNNLIRPTVKEYLDARGIELNYQDKLFIPYVGGIVMDKIIQAIEDILKEELQPLVDNYDIEFKSNLKGLNISRYLGKVKFRLEK